MKDRFFRNYFLSRFLFDFVFAYAIYNLFFNINGLSVLQISLLLAWWALNAMLFEVPSGALADKWSRRKMLTIAPLLKAICFCLWFLAKGNFWVYGLGFSFWALGSAFTSGTAEAMLYDHLTFLKQEKKYEKYLGKKKFYFYLALGVSIIFGGFIAHYKISWAIIFSVIPLLLSSFFAWFIKEEKKTLSTGEIKYFQHIKIALKELRTDRVLAFFMVYLVGISLFSGVEEYDQLYYKLIGLPVFAFGIIGFCWSLFNAFGSRLAHKIKNKCFIFWLMPLLGFILLSLVALIVKVQAIIFLLLAYFLYSPVRVLIESKIQQRIKTQSRATITSLSSFLIELSGVTLAPIFGLIGKSFGLPAIYFGFALLLLFLSFWTLFNKRKFI